MAPHDLAAKVYRKAQSPPAERHYLGHVPTKHRIGASVDVEVSVRASLTVSCYELLRVARWAAPPPLLRTQAPGRHHAVDEPQICLPEREHSSGNTRNGIEADQAGTASVVMSAMFFISTGFQHSVSLTESLQSHDPDPLRSMQDRLADTALAERHEWRMEDCRHATISIHDRLEIR